jgi:hypothetical protein
MIKNIGGGSKGKIIFKFYLFYIGFGFVTFND